MRWAIFGALCACGATPRIELRGDTPELQARLDAFAARVNEAGGCVWIGPGGAHYIEVTEMYELPTRKVGGYQPYLDTPHGRIMLVSGITDRLWRYAVAHEVGHAFGLAHTADPCSLMYPTMKQPS